MEKISVVIPTMWKDPALVASIQSLTELKFIGEIILFDNNKKESFLDKLNQDKMRVIINYENEGVNKPWNDGVYMSRNDNILIMNDDTVFEFAKIKTVFDEFTDSTGIVGMDIDSKSTVVTLRQIPSRTHGFGVAMFLRKDTWVDIPKELMIYYGDDWVLYNNGKTNYVAEGLNFTGHISKTVGDPAMFEFFNSKFHEDGDNYYRMKTELGF